MVRNAIRRPRLLNTPERVFSWKGREVSYFSTLLAMVVVGAAFTVLLGTVRVKLVSPKMMAIRKASLIYLTDGSQGRALALQAQEGGPFPSSFEPKQWEGMAALESEVSAASWRPSKPYTPMLRDLPEENLIQPMNLASKGESVFPKRLPIARVVPDSTKLKLAPTLYPLSGISPEAIPFPLPPFSAAVDGAMSSATWRFLVRLNPDGGVAECVSLAKGGEAGALALETWLRRVQFRTVSEMPSRWMAIGIGFSNQLTDGSDNH